MSADQKHIVFYADDDLDDLQLVDEAFSKHASNIQLETAEDGIEAIAALKQLQQAEVKPCLIILDINMPRLDGREVLVKIRQMDYYEHVPVIMFSTSSQPSDRDFAYNYNAGFITKPIDFTQLEVIVSEFVNQCTDEVKEHIRRKK